MNPSISNLSLENLKAHARRLRSELEATGTAVSHGRALELLARQYGYRDWNTLHAAVGNRSAGPPVTVGQTVSGRFIGQPFIGEVLGIQHQTSTGRYRVTLHFDEPVDVVTFDSFSNYRRRVTCTIDRSGSSVERLSNGVHHLMIDG